jgi:lysophospholipase L1-like esterase
MFSKFPSIQKHHLILAFFLLLTLLAGCGDSSSPFANSQQDASPAVPMPVEELSEDEQQANEAQNMLPLSTAAGFIAADDPLIRYTGRIDFSNPKRPRFDWPAVTIEAVFEGSSITALLDDGGNSYDVTIDGQTFVLHTKPDQTRYSLAEGLRDGQHMVRVVKRTETFYGTPEFLGFELDAGHKLASLPPAKDRRIEFVGDSITAGYGVEGDSPTCIFSPETENAALTYAAQTAEQLDAAYTIAAVSGVGVVRNYNSDGAMSAGTMLTYYGRTVANDAQENLDFTDWDPDAVVINLGTNDFSTTPHPKGEVFLNGYTNLIIKVRELYPQAHIFAVAGPLMVGPAVDTIRSVVTQMNQVLNDDRVHFVLIENTLELSAVDFGCDWHPNVSGQAKIAAQLAPAMAEVLGW